MADIAKLKALAEACGGLENASWMRPGILQVLLKTGAADAEFIATAKPAAVLELIAELESTNARLHEVAVACATAEQDRDQLKAENEALRKDAERYRWTSIEGNWVARMFGKWRAHIGEYGVGSPTEWYPSREEAIDAAMSKEAQP